jgi:hypothetical protein
MFDEEVIAHECNPIVTFFNSNALTHHTTPHHTTPHHTTPHHTTPHHTTPHHTTPHHSPPHILSHRPIALSCPVGQHGVLTHPPRPTKLREQLRWTVETGEAMKGAMRLHVSVETTGVRVHAVSTAARASRSIPHALLVITAFLRSRTLVR